MSGSANSTSRTKESIMEQILEQGQRLRNAMVKAILDGDPFYVDENLVKKHSPSSCTKNFKYSIHSTCECNKQIGYNTNCNSILNFHKYHTCGKNNEGVNKPEPTIQDLPSDDITKSIQDSYRSKCAAYFKHVNSLKVIINSLKLNQAGNRKVNASIVDVKYKLPTSVSHNYFIEYILPQLLVNVHKQNSHTKVDSGLSTNSFRMCSKKLHEEEIYFKHTSIHDIENLLDLDLNTIEIQFQVSCRTMKQKSTNIIGYGKFNMSLFEISKNLTCNLDIPIIDLEGLCFGLLKLSMQLGCGRIYFGKEFVDFVSSNAINAQTLHFNSSASDTPIQTERSTKENKSIKQQNVGVQEQDNNSSKPFNNKMKLNSAKEISGNILQLNSNITQKHLGNSLHSATNSDCEELLLFGLVYISEAQYFKKVKDTYLSCQVFGQGDTLCSRIGYSNKQPIFNFYQKVPFLLHEAFLSSLRNNSLRVDFWERCEEEDVIFGSTDLPLHQFYASYKNPTIVANILNNKLPVTISDWWEPISSIIEGDLCGQVKIIVALGTDAQIEHLEFERGIKELRLHVKPISTDTKKFTPSNELIKNTKTPGLFRRPNYLKSSNNRNKVHVVEKKVDVGIQSDFRNMEAHAGENSSIHNMLEIFLTKLQNQNVRNFHVENATNTDIVSEPNNSNTNVVKENLTKLTECRNETNMNLKKTSDLLDCLNDALSVDINTIPNVKNAPIVDAIKSFKACVVIEGALHLPSKRSYKSRKTKKKNSDLLPSPYVTFETALPGDIKMTPVILQSCTPNWNFSCDVSLPVELLSNNQKRLIFKVWSKSANTVHPNVQNDIVLGFAALDLTVLVSGLPSVQGWFNIVDFTSKCNGQIKIDVTPLENVNNTQPNTAVIQKNSEIFQNNNESQPKELLSGALKRKFSQLDEITQRLRARLADVTKEDSDLSNDGFAEEFERDINTPVVESNHDLISLSTAANSSSSSSAVLESACQLDNPSNYVSVADRELLQGKQRIDILLNKLTLLSNAELNDSFSNRYVSGCSLQQNNDELATKQGIASSSTFKQFNLDEFDSVIPSLTQLSDISVQTTYDSKGSNSSMNSRCPVNRYAPDGAGRSIDEESFDS